MARAEAQHVSTTTRLHNYASVQGEPVLLQAIRDHLKRKSTLDIDEKCIQVMSGGTSGLSVVCNTLLSAGDEVLLPAPFWPLIRGIVASRGATAVEIPFFTRLDETDFDVTAALETSITERTVALYINTPNNPTGRVLSPHVIDAMLKVAVKHNLWVLTDEAYEELRFTDEAPSPVWANPTVRDRVIATHTLSKGYGLAGARVGFTHGPVEIMAQIRAVQTFNVYCAARPMQLGAARALNDGRGWVDHARALYHEAGRRSADALGLPHPEGGTFLFFDTKPYLREGETSSVPFLLRCLDAGVLLTPGSASGRDYERYARLCFTCVPPHELDEALACLKAALNAQL